MGQQPLLGRHHYLVDRRYRVDRRYLVDRVVQVDLVGRLAWLVRIGTRLGDRRRLDAFDGRWS